MALVDLVRGAGRAARKTADQRAFLTADTTATARPPLARAISSAMLPRPPAPPHTSTGSLGSTTFGAQPMSMRYAVDPQSRKHQRVADRDLAGIDPGLGDHPSRHPAGVR